MSAVTFEAQYDAERGTVALAASTGYAERYVVTVPATSDCEAAQRFREFRSLYGVGERSGEREA